MKSTTLLTLAFILFVGEPGHAQWVPTYGPCGGEVWRIAVTGTNVIAGTTETGVFLTTDKGASWTHVSNGLPQSTRVSAFAVIGANTFMSTPLGVFISTDQGLNWSPVNFGLTDLDIRCLGVRGSELFAGSTRGGLVFRSSNNGTSWALLGTVQAIFVNSLAFSGPYVYAGTESGVFLYNLSADTGWVAVDSGLTNRDVQSLAVSGGNVLAGTYDGGVFRSTNNGKSWIPSNSGLTSPYLSCLSDGGTDLFAGTFGGGVFLSVDNGSTWVPVNAGLTNLSVMSLGANGTELFVGTAYAGVFHSPDRGASWGWASQGLPPTLVKSIATDGTLLYAGTDGAGVFISTDDGTTWIPKNSGLTNPWVYSIAVDGTNLFAGTAGSGVFLSTNNGTSWTQRGIPETYVLAFAFDHENVLAGTGVGIFRSSDYGTNWFAADSGIQGESIPMSFAARGTELFVGNNSGGVFLSTNNGISWTGAGLANTHILSLASSGTNLFAGTGEDGVFLSTDSGVSWNAVNEGIPKLLSGTYDGIESFAVSETDLFACNVYGIYLSRDNGGHWSSVNTGLTNHWVYRIALNWKNVYAITEWGVWSRPLLEMTDVASMQQAIPSRFQLAQNYPNPFNPVTSIVYSIGEIGGQGLGASNVRLVVYDLLGREVAVLVNEKKAPGSYDVKLDGSTLSSGVYFYRLQAEGFAATRKLLLLR